MPNLTKPYVKKPLVHSPRGEDVLANVHGYLIVTFRSDTPGAKITERAVRIHDARQCIAALRVAKDYNVRCLVYALGMVFGEECRELVDEEYLLAKIQPEPTPTITAKFERKQS